MESNNLTLTMSLTQLDFSERGVILTNPLSHSLDGEGQSRLFSMISRSVCLFYTHHFFVTCDPSPFHDHLASHQGKLTQNLRCHSCNVTWTREDPFRELQLFVRDVGTLRGSLEQFFGEEVLEGVDCDNCGAKHAHSKFPRLRALPYILTIQLMRFDLGYITFMRIKLNDPVVFEKELDLADFIEGGAEIEVEGEEGSEYELAAIFMHTGSAHWGHYFVYGRDFERGGWVNMNDSHTSTLTDEAMQSILSQAEDLKETSS